MHPSADIAPDIIYAKQSIIQNTFAANTPPLQTSWHDITTAIESNVLHSTLLWPTKEALAKTIKMHTVFLEAAGGIVYHPQKKAILFIYKNGFWDFPKGKIEKNERSEEAAIREVAEETNLKQLRLLEKITPNSIHLYYQQYDKKWYCKQTHWFIMQYNHTVVEETPTPQAIEGIEKVDWIKIDSLEGYYKNMYPLIKHYLELVLTKYKHFL